VLGVPVGSDQFIKTSVHDKLNSATEVLPLLKALEPGAAGIILTQCINQKPSYLLRTSPPLLNDVRSFDDKVDNAINEVCQNTGPFPAHSKIIRHLSSKHGGLGMRRLEYSDSQSASSFIQAARFLAATDAPWFNLLMAPCSRRNQFLAGIRRSSALRTVLQSESTDIDSSPFLPFDELDKIPSNQEAQLSRDAELYDDLLGALPDPEERAMFLSNGAPGTLRWFYLGCSPIPILRPSIDSFRTAMKMRLLLPIEPPVHLRTRLCACGHYNHNANASHSLSCRNFNGLKTIRHNHIVEALLSLIKSSNPNTSVSKEYPIEIGSITRIADIRCMLPSELFIDVAVVNPAAEKYRARGSSTEAGVPARVKEASKKGKYSILGHEIASRVVPFIVESTGRMGEEALSLVDSITKLNGPVLNPNGSLKRARNFFLNRISTSLVNANHRMLSAYLNKSDFVVSAPV